MLAVETDPDYGINYDELDAGVRRLVRWLRKNRFDTTDSGDGTKVGMECAWDCPMVSIREKDPSRLVSETVRLHALLESVGVHATPAAAPDVVTAPAIQANYDPVSGVSLITVTNVTDADLPDWFDLPLVSLILPDKLRSFESTVRQVLDKVFAEDVAKAGLLRTVPQHHMRGERTQRFLEEAFELAQAIGAVSAEQVHKLVDYVFDRPQGKLEQELGGAYVSLRALAETLGLNAGEAGLRELKRIQVPSVQERMRRRQAEKNAALGD